jgi:hypothetical protein
LPHTVLFLKTEFMLMDRDGSHQQQVTHFNSRGYPESNVAGKSSVAGGGEWHPDGTSFSALNLFLPNLETWTIRFKGPCGNRLRDRAGDRSVPGTRQWSAPAGTSHAVPRAAKGKPGRDTM